MTYRYAYYLYSHVCFQVCLLHIVTCTACISIPSHNRHATPPYARASGMCTRAKMCISSNICITYRYFEHICSTQVCVHIHIHIYTNICMCTHTYMYMYMYTYIYIYIYIPTESPLSTFSTPVHPVVSICVYMYIYIYIYIYIFLNIYIFIYI